MVTSCRCGTGWPRGKWCPREQLRTCSSSTPTYPTNGQPGISTRFIGTPTRILGSPQSITVVSSGPEQAEVRLEYVFGASRAVQTLRLARGSRALEVDIDLDWREHDRLLKVAFPIDVHADVSTSEIQFGHLERPTHTNTSWDAARFEFVAHRFVHVAEPGYGVAIVNGGIYGHEVVAIERAGGGKATLARLSSSAAPIFPIRGAKMGRTVSATPSCPEQPLGTPFATATTSTCPFAPPRVKKRWHRWWPWTMTRWW